MKYIFLFSFSILLYLFFYYASKSGKCGTIGKKIRESDYLAWKDAVNEKQEELKKLMKCKPKLE